MYEPVGKNWAAQSSQLSEKTKWHISHLNSLHYHCFPWSFHSTGLVCFSTSPIDWSLIILLTFNNNGAQVAEPFWVSICKPMFLHSVWIIVGNETRACVFPQWLRFAKQNQAHTHTHTALKSFINLTKTMCMLISTFESTHSFVTKSHRD